MAFNPVTDFLGLWRLSGGNVSALQMPGLDFVVAALARAGVVSLSVSATAPVANQSITAWLQAAVPSYSAEGVLNLWDKVTSAYAPATPKLFLQFLEACAGETGATWLTIAGGPPANTAGNDGDFAIRTDEPGGIYGPKTLGAWPATPIPGTTDVVSSTALDNTFGGAEGTTIYRGPAAWQGLSIGAEDAVLVSIGGVPAWDALSALFDTVFGAAQGSVLYRDALTWNDLPPGGPGQVLATGGAGANPSWVAKTPEFPSGTSMLFRQTTAPTGWTKQTALTDYGIRVTSGAVGTTGGTPFSTVFAQTAVGNTTLSATQMPSHAHQYLAVRAGGAALSGGSAPSTAENTDTLSQTQFAGGSTSHTHSISLAMAYLDVIIATKD